MSASYAHWAHKEWATAILPNKTDNKPTALRLGALRTVFIEARASFIEARASFIEARASPAKADRVSGKVAACENRLASVDGRVTVLNGKMNLLTWMLGFDLVVTMGVLWRLLAR